MLKRKRIRTRGKISFMRYFQRFESGDAVAIVRDLTVQSPGFPKRMQGRTGRVIAKRGNAYEIEVNDYNKAKRFTVKPVHLKKIVEAKQ